MSQLTTVQSAPLTFSPKYQSDTPRAYAKINGVAHNILRYELNINAHGASDTATIVLPKANTIDWSQTIFRGLSAGNADQPVYVQIYGGFPTGNVGIDSTQVSGLLLRFLGVVDINSAKFHEDEVTFTCRSLAAPLISTKITIPFPSAAAVTTTTFVKQVAQRFGLGTNIQVTNGGLTMQEVLADAFVSTVRNVSIWSLLLLAAMMDDVDVWVDRNGVLWYAAPSLIDPSRPVINLQYGADLVELEASHAIQFSKNIRVEVRSYVKKTRTSTAVRYVSNPLLGGVEFQVSSRVITSSPIFGTTSYVTNSISNTGQATSTISTVSGGAASGTAAAPANESGLETYVFYVKNKTAAQCQDLAQKYWRQISMHEYAIDLMLPVSPEYLSTMDVTAFIALSGAPWSLINTPNAKFWPRTIEEIFNPDDGFIWKIGAVNHTLPQGAV